MTSMDTIAKAGERRVTLKDIAKRLDVSHATVSRALNRPEDPLISEATKLRVLHAATEMGYRPNQAARTLATGRTGLVALWLWSEAVPNSYHAYVSQLMHAEAHRRSCQLIVDLVCWATLEARKDNLLLTASSLTNRVRHSKPSSSDRIDRRFLSFLPVRTTFCLESTVSRSTSLKGRFWP